MNQKNAMTYADAGVSIEAGNQLVNNIKGVVKKTHRPEVLGNLGGFAALFELQSANYQQPVLVSATDGVGTKLKLAIETEQFQTIGIDLVAMCVNDIIVCGAEPLFFLDYYATAKLDVSSATEVIAGIAEGCQQAGAALIGGETAEMPGLYANKDFDLAGFCVGVVEKNKIINNEKVKPGDVLLGLASSGPHSNGYSLIRQIIANTTHDRMDELLAPTKIYVKSMLALMREIDVHAVAHITGGGFLENIPRVLPSNLKAVINKNSWALPSIFSWLQEQGQVEENEMFRTFNCGIGMVVCVAECDASAAISLLEQQGETVFTIGEVTANDANNAFVEMR